MTEIKFVGSFVREKVRQDSDLDLPIEAGARTSPFFPGGLIADLEEALGRKVDVVEEAVLRRLLRVEFALERCGAGVFACISPE